MTVSVSEDSTALNRPEKATDHPVGEIPSDSYAVGAVSGERTAESPDTNSDSDQSLLTVGEIVATVFGAGYLLKRQLTDDQPSR